MKRWMLGFLPVAMGALFLSSVSEAQYTATAQDVPITERRTDAHTFVGLGGFQFLKISQGARAVGMGDAYTAVVDDINAIFWNPAGLTAIRGTAWTASYTRWLADSHVFSGAAAWNTGTARGGVLGLSVVAYRPPEMEETTIFQPQGTGEMVNAGDLSIGLVYALKMTDKFSFAARVSWINQSLFKESLSSISVDVGTHFHTGFKSLRLGMAMKHFGPDKTARDNKFIMPINYNVAAAMEVIGERGEPAYLTLSAESVFAVDYELRAHVGAEMWFQNIFALRAGYKANYDTDRFSVGVGVNYAIVGDRSVTVDLAYSDMGKYFNAPVRVTLGGTF